MLLCFFDYCDCSYHVRMTNRPSFLTSQLCYLGELSKLCFQISKVRTKKQRGALLLLVQKVGRLFLVCLFACYFGCLNLMILSCHFLSLVLIGFSLFFFSTLLPLVLLEPVV